MKPKTFFSKYNNIDKILEVEESRKLERDQSTNIRNERGDLITDTREIKRKKK